MVYYPYLPSDSFKVQVKASSFVFPRFAKKRLEEDLEMGRRKVLRLQAQTEGSSIIEELQQELREYREILKCSICLERPKEVNILMQLWYHSGFHSKFSFVGSDDD